MTTHWQKTSIPYFAVVQDNSAIRTSTFSTQKQYQNSSGQTENHQSEQYEYSSAPVLETPTCTYPEIEYVFLDDPNYDTLESLVYNFEEEGDSGKLKDEEALIIELDEQGESVRRYCSLSTQSQILGVHLKDRNMTKTIEVDVTRSAIDGVKDLDEVGNVEHIKKLIELFTLRNEQLKMIMDQS